MIMKKTSKALHALTKKGLFSAKEAYEAGISASSLRRLEVSGKIHKVARGVYVHSGQNIDLAQIDFAVACKKFAPKGVIGGLTALHWHGLIPNAPAQIWLIVPTETRTSKSLYRLIRSTHDCNAGVVQHGFFKITSLERTILESLIYQKKIGLRVAVAAARHALSSRLTTEAKLSRAATELGARTSYRKFWEVITIEEQ